MTIVRTTYRRKRAPKRKHPVAVPMRIVSAQTPRPTPPAVDTAAIESKPAQPATIAGPRIITASRKTSTRFFGPVQDLDAEEHQRRGDAAVELFREVVRRATGNGGT